MANQRFYKTDNQVKTGRKHGLLVNSLLTSGYLYFFTIMFSIFGIIFIGDTIKPWLKVIIGIAFMFPNVCIFFLKARTIATRDYNELNDTVLSDIHKQSFRSVSYFRSIIYILPYVVSALLLIIVFVAARVKLMVGIMEIMFAPMTLIFLGIGAHVNDASLISWTSVAIVGIYVAIMCASFIVGYIVAIRTSKAKTHALINEIRSYGK